jgi:membrane protease YdiL (CAAX protease family)
MQKRKGKQMMNKKIVIQFTVLTYIIVIIGWGGLSVCDGLFGFTLDEYPMLNLLYLVGAWSPAIASFIVLRKNNEVSGIKEWLKNIFTFRTSVYNYLFVVALSIIFIVSHIVTSGLSKVNPIYMFFIYIPACLLAGSGMEEAGWRYILQSEFNKKFGYLLSCLVIFPIHLLWHIPLGIGGMNLWNVTNILGGTFAIGAIHKISKGNVFLCVLFHCMINAGAMTITFNHTTTGAIVTPMLMIVVSIAAVSIWHIKNKDDIKQKPKADTSM